MASRSRAPVVALIAIGVGLVLAPLVFQMFTRAPQGGEMIDDFRPYMTTTKIDRFRGYLATIDDAEVEAAREIPEQRFPAVAQLRRDWPTIDRDMSDMLATMRDNLGRFRGMDALPPFVLFPWFFVVPGILVAVVAWSVLRSRRRGRPARRRVWALAIVGVGLVAAPAVFQMFDRAPGGARMIDDFRPLMTTRKVTTVQGYFLVLGAAEGQLRTEVLAASDAPSLPATREFTRIWPRMSNEMAPMIGTMADNGDNFAAVDALPPFWLFPWFFVLPGALVAGLALAAGRPTPPAPARARVEPSRGARELIEKRSGA